MLANQKFSNATCCCCHLRSHASCILQDLFLWCVVMDRKQIPNLEKQVYRKLSRRLDCNGGVSISNRVACRKCIHMKLLKIFTVKGTFAASLGVSVLTVRANREANREADRRFTGLNMKMDSSSFSSIKGCKRRRKILWGGVINIICRDWR